MKTLEERDAIEQAFRDGRVIEYCHYGDDTWYIKRAPDFNWTGCDYRVYRPVAYAYSDGEGNLTWSLSKRWVRDEARRPEFDIVAKEVP